MAKNVKEIKVDEAVRDVVESYDYEYSTRRDAITFMLSNNMDTGTEAFKTYQKEMIDFMAKFTKAKAEVEKKYVLPETNGARVNWTLDYETCLLTITYLD